MIWTFPQNGAPLAPYPIFRLDAFWACETPDGTLALAGKLPWGQLPSFSDLPPRKIYYIGFRGWDADLWHDGPEFSAVDGAVTACVLPGTEAPLPIGRRAEGFTDWLKEHEVLAWKKSLAKGFRERFDPQQGSFPLAHGSFRLEGLQNHPSHALVLLGLRLAFPHSNFFAVDHPLEFKPQWKRYCQNLNLSTWAAPSQLKGLRTLDICDISRLWPEASAARFLVNLNARIPCVPGKLAAFFSSP